MNAPLNNGQQRSFSLKSLRKFFWGVVIIWSVLATAVFIYEVTDARQQARDLMKADAHANFNKDQAFRHWAASHGGVYVPITATTQPNQYLIEVAERDIETPSGKKLTLMNPAYMMRQFNESFGKDYGVVGHITSLKLLNPDNKPDAWESKALHEFEKGSKEVFEYTETANSSHLRLMRPMYIKKSCLKCHAHQDYKVGDVRGGVGVKISSAPYYLEADKEIIQHGLVIALLWLMGLVGVWFSKNKIKTRILERDFAIDQITKLYMELEEKVVQSTEHIASLEQMLHMTSHELRRPVTTCMGLMNLLSADQPQPPQETKKMLKHLKTVAEEMDVFTRKLTTFMEERKQINIAIGKKKQT